MITNPKREMKAPCRFTYSGEKTMNDSYPDVNCSYNCESCGWNPEEQKRRLKKGHFEKRIKTLELHDDAFKEVVATVTEEVNTFIFPRRGENA